MGKEQEIHEDNDLITKANLAAKRIEEANAKNEALISRMEAVENARLLAGKGSAGMVAPPEPTETEKLRLGMKDVFKDSALDRYIK